MSDVDLPVHGTANPVRHIDIQTRARKPSGGKMFSRDDMIFLGEWPFLRLAAAYMPEQSWLGLAMRIERTKARLRLSNPIARAATIRRALALGSHAEAEAIAWRGSAGRLEHHIQVLKSNSGPGWQPDIRIEGCEHLDVALAQGRGAVLWVAHFCFNSLATKMALHEAGFPLAHLSRAEHGFSTSAFGIRWLNPLRCRAELRYLHRRIVIDPVNPAGALRQARAELAQNRFVSITAGAWEGRKIARGPLLGGLLPLATGAPGLAHLAGAPLLPVFTTRPAGSAAFRVRIDAPLPTDATTSATAIAAATAGFLASLETAILAAPDQWRGWRYLTFNDPPD